MSTFTLAISGLTTSSLPWFMDLRFQVPMQYCSLQHRILLLSPVTSTAGYCFCFGSIPSFFLELFLHWSPSSILGTYWPGEFLFQYPIVLPFHTVHGVLMARILKWFSIPFSSGPHSVRPLHHDPPVWVAPRAWLSLIELDKAVVHVIRLTRFLLLWFVCLPSDASHNTYCFTWVSFTLDVGYLFMAAPAKHSHCSLPWTWGSSSRPCLWAIKY